MIGGVIAAAVCLAWAVFWGVNKILTRRLNRELAQLKILNAAYEEQRRRAAVVRWAIRNSPRGCHNVICAGCGQHPCHDLDCKLHDMDAKRKRAVR